MDFTHNVVARLVGEILRSNIIDEPDLRVDARPFMKAVHTHGLCWERAPAAILETFGVARRAIDRLAADRATGMRAPAREWSPEEVRESENLELLRVFYPGRGYASCEAPA